MPGVKKHKRHTTLRKPAGTSYGKVAKVWEFIKYNIVGVFFLLLGMSSDCPFKWDSPMVNILPACVCHFNIIDYFHWEPHYSFSEAP